MKQKDVERASAPPKFQGREYIVVLFLVTLLLLGRLLWPFLSILVLAFLLAGIFQPVYTFFRRWLSPNVASLVTCVLIVLVVFVPLTFFVASLSSEAYGLYQSGKNVNLGVKLKELMQENELLARIRAVLDGYGVSIAPEDMSAWIADATRFVGLFLYNKASSWAANIMTFLLDFFIMILTIFFLLIDHRQLLDYLLRLLPLPSAQGQRLLDKFQEIAGAVLIGNGVCGLIQGTLGGVLFALFDLGPPILWGGVMAILAFLPIFGIGLVLIPVSVIMLLKGRLGLAIGVFVFYLLLSFSVEYVLKPKMVGERVQMHTLLVFLAIMGGLSVFGFLGIIYGPLIVTAFLTMAEMFMMTKEATASSEVGGGGEFACDEGDCCSG